MMSLISLLVHFEDGGRYDEQIVINLNSVARTAIACEDELISISLCAVEFFNNYRSSTIKCAKHNKSN